MIQALVAVVIYVAGIATGIVAFNYALRLGLRIGQAVKQDEDFGVLEEPTEIHQEGTI